MATQPCCKQKLHIYNFTRNSLVMSSLALVTLVLTIRWHLTLSLQWTYSESGTNDSMPWSDQYPECGSTRQSPIDITKNDSSNCSEPLRLQWTSPNALNFIIQNNGRSLDAIPIAMDDNLKVLRHSNDTQIRLESVFDETSAKTKGMRTFHTHTLTA